MKDPFRMMGDRLIPLAAAAALFVVLMTLESFLAQAAQ